MSSPVDIYEKLGVFYLGRVVDTESGEVHEAPLLYDSKDLTTHGVCVGMTGSGKTGLCVTLLEEAAIDGVPSLVIDVKGDLTNMLLTFPDLAGEDFRPWIDEAAAERKNQSPDEFAAAQAQLWRDGLGKWHQDGDRIARLREAAEFAIYTPGSESGLPVSILSSFSAPSPEVLDDRDLMQERITNTAASLLALLGIDADPVRSREAILLATVFQQVWGEGQDLDLASLIEKIQNPPIERVGVLPLESFYPAEDRFELAMALNNLLASPSFQGWLEGQPLDIDSLLYSPEGKPRVAIFSIAYLADSERMFFVSLLLNHTLGWVRTRSGTSSLRAILYMDEIFGYLPPVGNPPSKKPLLTLLKQARAFGFGVLLATQNPVDLDYKALSNIGTWFLGRLQTERDKARMMDGLLSTDASFDKAELERMISGLDKRVFLLHNVHERQPVLFRVRWAMSYLRGPLTRRQIKKLMADHPLKRASMARLQAGDDAEQTPAATRAAQRQAGALEVEPSSSILGTAQRPVLPRSITEVFEPTRERAEQVLYRPALVGEARVHFVDRKRGLEAQEELLYIHTFELEGGGDGEVDWQRAALSQDLVADDLDLLPSAGARFAELPAAAADRRSYSSWKKDFADMLYRQRRWILQYSEALDLVAEPGESERDFRVRLADRAHELRDQEVEELRERYARRLDAAAEKIRRAEQKVERERGQAQDHRAQSMLSAGTTLLGALFGRKKLSVTNLRRASSTVKRFGRGRKESQDVDRAEEDLMAYQQQLEELEQDLEREIGELQAKLSPSALEIGSFEMRPRRTDVDVRRVAILWRPYRVAGGIAEPMT